MFGTDDNDGLHPGGGRDVFLLSSRLRPTRSLDFQWGTASAQPVTLSFVASCTQGGAFSGSLCPYSGSRSYPFTFSLTANTRAKIVIVIPGDTGGPWVLAGNAGVALSLRFDLGSGATMRGPANAWAAANYVGATGSVSVVAANGANFFLTGVKLEIGTVATPYNRQSLAKSMADCQRYYQTVQASARFNSTAANQISDNSVTYYFMRSAPTVTLGLAGSVANLNAYNMLGMNANSARFEITSAGSGDAYNLASLYVLNAEL